MLIARHTEAMPAIIPTVPPIVPDEETPPSKGVAEQLVVRVAAPSERDSLDELATRAGAVLPRGALMVGAIGNKLMAAVSISDGHVLSEPTTSGAAAAAVVSHRVASLGRARRH
jgi:hypothetical protein